jgi:hypothetical protein
MNSLHDLGIKYGTDKAHHHFYMGFYQEYFDPIRYQIKNLLEIGVWNGSSIKVWLDYFPNAHIYGIDNVFKSNVFKHDRFSYIIGDATNHEVIDTFQSNFFDVVIDDGSHFVSDQLKSLKGYWSKLKINGCFIMEDLHTSFINHYVDTKPTTYNFLFDEVKIEDLELNSIKKSIKLCKLFHNNEVITRSKSITAILKK